MHLRRASEDFSYEVSVPGKEVIAVTTNEFEAKGYIIASSSQAIELDFRCFQVAISPVKPNLILEFYIDGVLRNIVKPHTGRGMPIGQFAEAKIDRGLILTKNGLPIMKKFRFIDLDLDEAVYSSRIVMNAGEIKVKVIDAGAIHDPFEDDWSFELPSNLNDRGCITFLEGEINNTVGIRFDDGESSIKDSKHIILQQSYHAMLVRQDCVLGRVLAEFTFIYGSDDLLNQLGVITPGHKLYDQRIGDKKYAVGKRTAGHVDKKWIEKSLYQSDYTFVGMTMENRYEPVPFVDSSTTIATVIGQNTKANRSPKSTNVLTAKPKERLSGPRPSGVGKHSSTPRKSYLRPGMVRDGGLFAPSITKRNSAPQPSTPSPRKRKCVDDIGLLTPPPTLRTAVGR